MMSDMDKMIQIRELALSLSPEARKIVADDLLQVRVRGLLTAHEPVAPSGVADKSKYHTRRGRKTETPNKILAHLKKYGPSNLTSIAKAIGRDPSALYSAIKTMMKYNVVSRNGDLYKAV
jgi:hypothetical protein